MAHVWLPRLLHATAVHVAPALAEILDVMGKKFKVRRIFADAGKEFMGKTKKLLEDRNVKFTMEGGVQSRTPTQRSSDIFT